jgi:hypothetical protein
VAGPGRGVRRPARQTPACRRLPLRPRRIGQTAPRLPFSAFRFLKTRRVRRRKKIPHCCWPTERPASLNFPCPVPCSTTFSAFPASTVQRVVRQFCNTNSFLYRFLFFL